MNRKGQESDSRTAVLVAIVAFVVIAVVFVFLFNQGGAIKKWFSFLPGFNESQPFREEIRYVRYNILEGKIEYHSGVEWVDFNAGDKIKLGEKEFYGAEVYDALTEFYRSTKTESDEIILDSADPLRASLLGIMGNEHGSISPKDYGNFLLLKVFNIQQVEGERGCWLCQYGEAGDYHISVASGRDGEKNRIAFGMIVYRVDDEELYFVENEENSVALQNSRMSITSATSGLRDKIEKEIVQSRHEDLEKIPVKIPQMGGSEYCIDVREDRYVIADLTKSVRDGEECSLTK